MIEDGFRIWNFYGSYYASEEFNGIGLEIGVIDVPNDDGATAHTFSIVLKISHFLFAIGYILRESD